MAHPQHIEHIVDKLKDPHNHDTTAFLVFCQLGAQGADVVANALLGNPRLRRINLSKNLFNSQTIAPFLPVFRSMDKLEALDLSYNALGGYGTRAVCDALQSCDGLSSLNLADDALELHAAEAIAELLVKSKRLTQLDLPNNQLDQDAIKVLAEGIKINQSLTGLNVSHNPLDDHAIELLADALKQHPHLERLNLSCVRTHDLGVKALASAMQKQKKIAKLDLSLNSISDTGVKLLADWIKSSGSIIYLDLQQNHITDKGANALLAALERNRSLCTLHLQGNQINHAILAEIEARIRYNREVADKYLELHKRLKAANIEPLPVHQYTLLIKAAPLAYRLTEERYRDAPQLLKQIHYRLGKLLLKDDPVAAWHYFASLTGEFPDIKTNRLKALVNYSKEKDQQLYYEKALLLMRENGEPFNMQEQLIDVLIGLFRGRGWLTAAQLTELTKNFQQLVGAEKAVLMSDLVLIARRVQQENHQGKKTDVVTKVSLQPGYVTANEIDIFLRNDEVRKLCLEKFGTANVVTYEHLLVCPEMTALNHALSLQQVKDHLSGAVKAERDIVHFTTHQQRIETDFQDRFGRFEEFVQKGLTVFYQTALLYAQGAQEKYQVVLDIYLNNVTLCERLIDLINYLLICREKDPQDPWVNTQLEFLLTEVGENVDSRVLHERLALITKALLGDEYLTRWQTRRMLLQGAIVTVPKWRRFWFSRLLKRAEHTQDPKERFRLLSGYLRSV